MEILYVTGLYVAGVMGAGFASGQELVVFFVNYGWGGLIGIFLAISLLTICSGLVLDYCSEHSVSSYKGLFASLGPRMMPLFDWIYTLFLFIGVSVMLAGIGSMGVTGITQFLFRFCTALLLLAVLRRGVYGVLEISAWLAPAIIILLGLIAVYFLQNNPISISKEGSWIGLEAGILYAAYNLGFSMAVLASTHHVLTLKRQRWAVALLGNLVLGISMLLIYFGLSTLLPAQLEQAFPLEYLALNWSPLVLRTYRLILWAAMFTTAMANSFALISRIKEFNPPSLSIAVVFVIALSLIFSYVGFSTLIKLAYPVLGLAGLWFLLNLIRLRVLKYRLFRVI